MLNVSGGYTIVLKGYLNHSKMHQNQRDIMSPRTENAKSLAPDHLNSGIQVLLMLQKEAHRVSIESYYSKRFLLLTSTTRVLLIKTETSKSSPHQLVALSLLAKSIC